MLPPLELKRQYLGFFWERFEAKDGVILKSVPAQLFSELIAAEKAFYESHKTEKATESMAFPVGILSDVRLRG